MPRRPARRRGFAMLEVLISMEILAFGIVPIVALYPAILGAMSTGVRKSVAAHVAESAIEELIRLDYADQLPSALGPAVQQDASWPETLHYTRSATVEYVDPNSLAVAKNDTGLKRITVTVTWMNRSKQESLTFSTLSSTYD